MGILALEDDKEIFRHIRRTLQRRGLKPDLGTEEWEVHGPHPGMNYQVYVGYVGSIPETNDKCTCRPPNILYADCPVHGVFCVAIYPGAVYQVEDPSKWSDTKPEERIFIRK